MYQTGSVSTPGTCTQGKLLHYVPGTDADQTIVPQQELAIAQCGTPFVLAGPDGVLHMFVAGQAGHASSPSFAPWPLAPLYLRLRPESEFMDLTLLPDRVGGIQRFVSGVPSAIIRERTMLAYFNGGQLLEYEHVADSGWKVSAIPMPCVVADANPIAAFAEGNVYVVTAPRGETLLLGKRDVETTRWHFVELGAHAPELSFGGDPAISEFEGQLHIFVCAASDARSSRVQELFELWDFLVGLDGNLLEARSVSAAANSWDGIGALRVTGTPSTVSTHHRLQVFVRSEVGQLLEFRSTDGQEWECFPVSQARVGGDAGAVVSEQEDSVVYARDPMGYLTEFRETGGIWQGRRISCVCTEGEGRPRPVNLGRQVRIFDLDVPL